MKSKKLTNPKKSIRSISLTPYIYMRLIIRAFNKPKHFAFKPLVVAEIEQNLKTAP